MISENIIHQQNVADCALRMIYQIDPYAIVAGGAPRDWHFHKEASDIDLFFSTKAGVTISVVEEMLKKAGLKIDDYKCGNGLPEWYKINKKLRCVFNTTIYDVPVQLILVEGSTFKIVDEFPLSISKAWYKNGRIHLEPDFLHSKLNNIIFKTNMLYANGHAYLQKILGKFPEYKYVESLDKQP